MKFIRRLLALFITITIWVAILWFFIKPNFGQLSYPGMAGIHIIPPLVLWSLGLWIFSRHRNKAKRKAEAAEKQVEQERQTRLKAAMQEHDEVLAKRRQYCDCRAILISQLGVVEEEPLLDTKAVNIVIETHLLKDDADIGNGTTMIDWFKPTMTEIMANIYSLCGAAVNFPIYLVFPSEIALIDITNSVRQSCKDVITELGLSQKEQDKDQIVVLTLPQNNSIANTVLDLFENTPNLYGAVVLAFDSPLFRTTVNGFSSEPPRAGKASEGIISFLFTHPQLVAHITSLPEYVPSTEENESMITFWEKDKYRDSKYSPFFYCPTALRKQLIALPVLGRIHLSTQKYNINETPAKTAAVYQNLIENAQINAGLLEQPFTFTPKEEEKTEVAVSDKKPLPKLPETAWLVHNGGLDELVSKRLPVLGNAFQHIATLPIDPVDDGLNINTRIGNLGKAAPAVQLALSIAYAAALEAPVLSAEFIDDHGINFDFVTPSPQENT